MSGFEFYPDVVSARECEAFAALGLGRAGTRHLMSCAAVSEVACDERMLRIAREWLGGEAVPYKATLFEKSERANWVLTWHQDRALPVERKTAQPEWGPWSDKRGVTYVHAPRCALEQVIALRLHLDPSTADNGPLRVVPGSHEAGVLTDAEVIDYANSHPQAECISPAGGVIAMRPLLIHASSKNRSGLPRRVLHIEYATSLDLAPGVRLRVV